MSILISLVLFFMMIAVHEGGHFVFAKFLGINVYEFSLGMGPRVLKSHRNGTDYSLRAFPVGGFCNFETKPKEGPDGSPIFHEETEGDLSLQPSWAKIAVYTAGSFMNVFFGILMFTLSYKLYYGMSISLADCMRTSFALVGFYTDAILNFITGLFTGGSGAGELIGVVGVVDVISDQVEYGLPNLINFFGVLNINIGIMNMLPIPALDGGRILFEIIRKLSGGRFSKDAENKINAAAMLLLLLLMIVLIIKDSLSLF